MRLLKGSSTDILTSRGRQKPVAYPFVLEALEDLEPTTRAMFGSTAVYIGERVLFILRKKGDPDDGVWVAFDEERGAEAVALLPNLVRIERLPNVRCWRKLAERSPHFEDDVLEACRLARDAEGPLGKIPVRQKAKKLAPTAVSGAGLAAANARPAQKRKKTPAKSRSKTRLHPAKRGARPATKKRRAR